MNGRPGKLLSPVVIVVLAMVVYLNSLPNEFIWDDSRAISRNYLIKRIHHVPRIFVSDLYSGTGEPAGNYRPLVLTSFAVDFAIFGARPWAYRSVNLVLHAGASLLVLLLLSLLLRRPGEVPLLAALLFATHPVHAEAVAVVMGRAEVMATCLVFGGWIVYLMERPWSLGLSLLLFFLSLLCKETAAIFPLLVAVGSIHRGVPSRRVARDFLLGVAVVLIYIPIRLHALGGFIPPEKQIILPGLGLLGRVEAMLPIFREYVLLALFPVKLSLDYQFLALPGAFSTLEVLSGAVLLVGMAGLALAGWRGRSPTSLAFLLFFIPLLPVSNVIPLGEIMGERLLYLPSVGVCLGLALVLVRAPRFVRWGLLGVLLTGYGAITVDRNEDLADRGTAALAMLRHYPASPKAFAEVGNHYARLGLVEEARRRYQGALQIRPGYVVPQSGLGELLLLERRIDEAERHFRDLRDAHPAFPHATFKLGKVLLRKGDREGAKALFEEMLAIRESEPDARMNIGVIAYEAGDREGAERLFREVLFFHPDHAATLENLAAVLAEAGRFGEAASAMRKAIRWGAPTAESWFFLGSHEYRTGPGRRTAALRAFEQALQMDPAYRNAHFMRGTVLLDLLRYADAESVFRRLREGDPADATVLFNHARALDGLGSREEAIRAYRAFLDLYEGEDEGFREDARARIRALGGRIDEE